MRRLLTTPVLAALVLLALLLFLVGWLRLSVRDSEVADLPNEFKPRLAQLTIKAWHSVESLPETIAQFETVFWEPDDTTTLRRLIVREQAAKDLSVLDIGTGTGLLAITCLLNEAQQVTATDINPTAVANARYNAEVFGVAERLDVRLVATSSPAPFSVVQANERFDLILSNPPWEDGKVERVDQYALYDPGMELCDCLLNQGASHLAPKGRMLLAYGAKLAIARIRQRAPELGWTVTMLDDRDLDALPEVFVPAVVLELKPVATK